MIGSKHTELEKYKLVMAKIREEKYLISDESQLQQKFMELLVNEDMDEAFVNTSFGYFDRTNISKKFIACDEKLLYEIYYEYGTNFTHGFWGAIRESAMLICVIQHIIIIQFLIIMQNKIYEALRMIARCLCKKYFSKFQNILSYRIFTITNEWRLNMVENKLLKKISTKYQNLLEKYEDKVEELSIEDIKRLIGEVRLFWYRQQTCVTYLLSNIEKDDNVAYLAGAMRLDIVNDGHFDFALVGNYRVINDPIVRFTSFYFRTESEINFDYLNKYLKDCIKDLLLLFKKYQDDFYILPMEPINTLDLKQYYSILSDAAENMVLALFDNNYSSVDAIMEECCSYDDVDMKIDA